MRKTLLTVATAGVAFASVGALNAHDATQPGAIDLTAVQSGSYTVDSGHSMVAFSINHLGFNDYFGLFGDVAGTLTLDKSDMSKSSVDVTIPVASVTVPSQGLKEHLLRPGKDGGTPDFFGAEPAPAHFVSTAIHRTGETSANITGDLTLNGVTKPVTLAAELAGMGSNAMSQKATLGFHGTTTINRSEFNLPFAIQHGIADKVDLRITVAFEK